MNYLVASATVLTFEGAIDLFQLYVVYCVSIRWQVAGNFNEETLGTTVPQDGNIPVQIQN